MMKKRFKILAAGIGLFSVLFLFDIVACTKKGDAAYTQLEQLLNEEFSNGQMLVTNTAMRNGNILEETEYSICIKQAGNGGYIYIPNPETDDSNYYILVYAQPEGSTFYFEENDKKLKDSQIPAEHLWKNTLLAALLNEEGNTVSNAIFGNDLFTDKNNYKEIKSKKRFNYTRVTITIDSKKAGEFIEELTEFTGGYDYSLKMRFEAKNNKLDYAIITLDYKYKELLGQGLINVHNVRFCSEIRFDRTYDYLVPSLSDYADYDGYKEQILQEINAALSKNSQMRSFILTAKANNNYPVTITKNTDLNGNISAIADYSKGFFIDYYYNGKAYTSSSVISEKSFDEFFWEVLAKRIDFNIDITKLLDFEIDVIDHFYWTESENYIEYQLHTKNSEALAGYFSSMAESVSFYYRINKTSGYAEYISVRLDRTYTFTFSNMDKFIDVILPDLSHWGNH